MTAPQFLLARIDDRLLHGQVAIGWAAALGPSRIFVVDDGAASSPWEGALYSSSPPAGASVEVVTVEGFPARMRAPDADPARSFLLMRSPETALRLLELGLPFDRVNVGGIRHRDGAREILPYVWLRPADEEAFRRLAEQGVRLLARDLPMNPEHDLAALLGC